MNKLKSLAGQTIIYGMSTIAVRALNWLLAPYHSQVFKNNPADFGIVAEMFAYVAFINVIFMYGLETAFFRYATKRKDEANKVFTTALLSLLVSTTFFVGLIGFNAEGIASALLYPGKGSLVLIIALIIGFDTLSNIPFARLRLEGKPLKYVGIKAFNVAINILFNFLLLYPIIQNEPSLFGYTVNPAYSVYYVFVANLIASVVTFIIFIPGFFKQPFVFCKETWQQMMQYGLPLIIVGLAGMVNETIDRILLKFYLPIDSLEGRLKEVGIYSMAYKLSIFMSIAVQGFRMGAEPFFFKQAEDQDAKTTYSQIMTYFVIASVLIFLGVTLNLDWIMLILSEPFRAAKGVVPIVLMAYLFLGIFYNLSVWYKLTDNTMKATYIAIAGAIITIVINVMAIPKYGYYASAWATLAAYFAMTLISFIWGKKYYAINYNVSKILAYIVVGIGVYVASNYIRLDSLLITILLKNVVLAAFLTIVFLVEKPNFPFAHKQST